MTELVELRERVARAIADECRGDGGWPAGGGHYDRAERDHWHACADRVFAVLEATQPDHLIELRADGWTTQHSMACRLTGALFDCPINQAAVVGLRERPASIPDGRYVCSVGDTGGLIIGRAVPDG